jgi:ElaA protein
MERAMATIPELFGDKKSIRIEAQAHLEKFYGSLGFVTQSKPYMLDGIPHIEMLF